MRSIIRGFFWVLLLLVLAAFLAVAGINGHVVLSEKPNIAASMTSDAGSISNAQLKRLKKLNAQCIMVLGAGIIGTEKPTPMLKDRLDTALKLYWAGVSPKILLTGDNGSVHHNELHVMLKYVRKAGVPEADIFCDHAGFSTYDSAARAKQIFRVKRMIVVTQTYHMYRALYDCSENHITALGVGADQQRYSGQLVRDVREVPARLKDFILVQMEEPPKLGGEVIPITGSGVISHGE